LPEDVELCYCATEKKKPSAALYVVEESSEGQENAAQFIGDDQFIHGLGKVMSLWVCENAAANRPANIGRFHSSRPPAISIQDYIKRLRAYFFCSEACFVIALVYIDRISKNCASVTICDASIHRLLAVAVMVAAKFHDDQFYGNGYYARCSGLTVKEINMLEAFMLKELHWSMFVTVKEYQLYHDLVCMSQA
jgi:hypothetical protein